MFWYMLQAWLSDKCSTCLLSLPLGTLYTQFHEITPSTLNLRGSVMLDKLYPDKCSRKLFQIIRAVYFPPNWGKLRLYWINWGLIDSRGFSVYLFIKAVWLNVRKFKGNFTFCVKFEEKMCSKYIIDISVSAFRILNFPSLWFSQGTAKRSKVVNTSYLD